MNGRTTPNTNKPISKGLVIARPAENIAPTKSFVLRASRQLVRFGHGKKLVESVEPGEIITVASIEKSLLPNVDVKEAQERTKRQTLRKPFQATPAFDRRVGQFPRTAT